MNGFLSFGLAITLFVLLVAVAVVLATRDTRRIVLVLVFLGLLAALLKIFLFQLTPQWHDFNPDSITYDLNARAFVDHWHGLAVEGQSHNLRGVVAFNAAGLIGAEWLPGDGLSYATVIGSDEWIYTGYIALWYWLSEATQEIVTWSNALWAAFFPAAAFGITYSLGASRRVALMAAGLALLDPNAGVNASSLLKDTLAGFLTMTALWGSLAYLREGGKGRLLLAALALSGLGGVRFVAFLALVIAAGLVSVWLVVRGRERRRGLILAAALSFAWLLNGLVIQAPHFGFFGEGSSRTYYTLIAPAKTFLGGVNVLRSTQGDATADNSVLSWKEALEEAPAEAIMRSAARTLFSPYPWIPVFYGLNLVSFNELYYPGVVLWILCLPGVFTALVQGVRQNKPGFWLLALYLAALLAAYTIWLGEWSTRQRVFALPAFFALAAIGWAQLWECATRRRATLSQVFKR